MICTDPHCVWCSNITQYTPREVDDSANAPTPRAALDHVALQEARWRKPVPRVHAVVWLVLIFSALAATGLASALLNP